ncbi:TPA: hypothetical protein ACQUHP_005930 [Bacillus cereus]
MLIFPQIMPILVLYSLLGFILIPFFNLRPRIILNIAGILASCNMISTIGIMVFRGPSIEDVGLVPLINHYTYYILVIISMFLLGIYVAEMDLFQQLSQQIDMVKHIHKMSFFLSLPLILGGLWTAYINLNLSNNIPFMGINNMTFYPLSIFYRFPTEDSFLKNVKV